MAMDEQPSSLSLIMKLASRADDYYRVQETEEREIKVLQRTRVSHLLKTVSPAFGGYIEKDFEAYLVRSDMEIPLNTAFRLSDYQCKNLDVIELRRREQPITLAVNIYADEVRKYEVNASLPVSEIVKYIGEQLGVENTKELSLSLPSASEKNGVNISCMNWLDVTRSLNAQGVEDGDMVLLRKKFFMINEDIQEAEQNDLLKKLISYQLQTQLAHAKEAENRRKYSNETNLSSGSEQESINEEMVSSPGLLPSVMQAFGTPEKSPNCNEINGDSDIEPAAAKKSKDIMTTLTKHRSHFTAQFEVKASDESEVSYLCCHSTTIFLSKEPKVNETNVIKKWSINELTWDRVENGLKLGQEEDSQTYSSEHTSQIIDYLSHMKSIILEKESPAHIPYQLDTTNSASSTPMSSPMKKKTPSITLSILSISSSHSSKESLASPKEEAGVREISEDNVGATGTSVQRDPSDITSPSHKPRRERKTNITPPSYFGKEFSDLMNQYILIHVNVLNEAIRPILVNIDDPVRLVVRDICATFDIQYPDEHYLRVPATVEKIIEAYGGKPGVELAGGFTRRSSQSTPNVILNEDETLFKQMDFDLKPYMFVLRRRGFDDIDAAEKYSLDIGEEWPDGEDPDVARYRRFYQSWMGIVQGDYPITKKIAVKFAGLLTYIYHGSKARAPFWPPPNYDVNCFLPEKYHEVIGMKKDVLKAHQENEGKTLNEAINDVIDLCQNIPSASGIYFTIKVPSSGTLRKRMETKTFGLRPQGLICFDKDSRNPCWQQAYTDIKDWAAGRSSFSLKFNDKRVADLFGYSYQAKQIMEIMNTYVKMQYKVASKKEEFSPEPVMSDV